MVIRHARKKPVVIQAVLVEDTAECLASLSELSARDIIAHYGAPGAQMTHLTIFTLEGEMRAEVGDWIIKGVVGEVYPCKSDVFEKTYDIVTDPEASGGSPTIVDDAM